MSLRNKFINLRRFDVFKRFYIMFSFDYFRNLRINELHPFQFYLHCIMLYLFSIDKVSLLKIKIIKTLNFIFLMRKQEFNVIYFRRYFGYFKASLITKVFHVKNGFGVMFSELKQLKIKKNIKCQH